MSGPRTGIDDDMPVESCLDEDGLLMSEVRFPRRRKRVEDDSIGFIEALSRHIFYARHYVEHKGERRRDPPLMYVVEKNAWERAFTNALPDDRIEYDPNRDAQRAFSELYSQLQGHSLSIREYRDDAWAEDVRGMEKVKDHLMTVNAPRIAETLSRVVAGLRANVSTRVDAFGERLRFPDKDAVQNYIKRKWRSHTKQALEYIRIAKDLDPASPESAQRYADVIASDTTRQATELGNALNQMIRNRRI